MYITALLGLLLFWLFHYYFNILFHFYCSEPLRVSCSLIRILVNLVSKKKALLFGLAFVSGFLSFLWYLFISGFVKGQYFLAWGVRELIFNSAAQDFHSVWTLTLLKMRCNKWTCILDISVRDKFRSVVRYSDCSLVVYLSWTWSECYPLLALVAVAWWVFVSM